MLVGYWQFWLYLSINMYWSVFAFMASRLLFPRKKSHGGCYSDPGEGLLKVEQRKGESWKERIPDPSQDPARQHSDGEDFFNETFFKSYQHVQ